MTTASDIAEAVNELVRELYAAKQQMDRAAVKHAALEAQLLDMIDDGTRMIVVDSPVSRITTTVVRGSRIIIDEDRLKKQLGTATWKRVSSLVLDKAKLEAAIALGDVDPNTVAMVSEEKPNKPYFKFKEEAKQVTKKLEMSPAAKKLRLDQAARKRKMA